MSIKSAIKIFGVTVLALLLVFAALGPAKLQIRSGLGWRIDHFVGYFALTLTVCLVWRRPLLVGGVLTAAAIMLEGLQSFTPDRLCDLQGALYSAGGVVAAMLPGEVVTRALGRLNEWTLWPAANTELLPVSRRFSPLGWPWSLSTRS
jgi:VanZ family protein